MTASVIRIGASCAYPLRSGGWMCTRPGDAFPTWRHDEHAAAQLLRSWLPTVVPPVAGPCRGGQNPCDGRDLDGLDGITPHVLSSSAPGSSSGSPQWEDPGAPQTWLEGAREVGASTFVGACAPTGTGASA